ncbi:TadE/TadG family type IV pilus assembly protein [Sphingomonas baiyangensis]|uniref:Pilus assembly protein TadG n=1 Tax=Sphingomonas baiyangensis TaxID=2572576 RepID=A0A4U1L3K3_9SPHN|nr:TadE/TadG family type IV pilus assembly protein [Sphingomonas baiyangensis]TKD50696.1 pilus assembly protein TadG [Sphingomonas baiyangensis]
MHEKPITAGGERGFLSRLLHDRAGNTMAIVGAAMFPLVGMVGGGFDLSRMYIVKTRLQHACDAGALAGRKAMGGGTWAQQSGMPNTEAQRFFDANFRRDSGSTLGVYGSKDVTRQFAESAGKVTGTATAVLPMTLMRVLGKTTETLTVTCDAEMRLPNTDVMFVLDVTGSMNCKAGDTSCTNNGNVPATDSKIEGLQVAVKCFYEIVARLDTSAPCVAGAPSGGTGSAVQIRFGFVPYASNVNVGKILPVGFMANSWKYQSRKRDGSEWSDWYYRGVAYPDWRGNCAAAQANTATQENRVQKRYVWQYGQDMCVYERRDLQPRWHYALHDIDVSGLKNGTGYRDSFTVAGVNNDGSDRTVDWSGCIEERQTVRATNFSPIPAGAKDLDIDLVPTSGDVTTQWGPALPSVIWARNVTSNWNEINTAETRTTTNYYNNVPFECPTASRKLQQWPDATAFDAYVDSFRASGSTYHDIGMIWGARLLSPTGIFSAENALTPQGGEIERHLIYMTDGDTSTINSNYTAYGLSILDRRQTDAGEVPSNATLNDQVNLRFAAVCEAVKNKNITLWVVSFGGGINTDTENRLRACASSNRYFTASDSAALQTTFKSIADQISALRLTR